MLHTTLADGGSSVSGTTPRQQHPPQPIVECVFLKKKNQDRKMEINYTLFVQMRAREREREREREKGGQEGWGGSVSARRVAMFAIAARASLSTTAF